MHQNRGQFSLTTRDAEEEGACTEDSRFADRDGDGCDVYFALLEFCGGAEQLSAPSLGMRSARDSCCAYIGKPAPSTPVTLLNGTCSEGTRRKLNACLALDAEPADQVMPPSFYPGDGWQCQNVLQDIGCSAQSAVVFKDASDPSSEFCAEAAEYARVTLRSPQLFCGPAGEPPFLIGPNENCCRGDGWCAQMPPMTTSMSGCAASVDASGQVCEISRIRVERLELAEDAGVDDLPDMD
uniref:Uncharacterized protein n=1 Tax=Chromera velia CCMP2878 TaxID=1169474 RepID=A0A0G4HTF4_9ALVE|eukprot:Cvel_20233.t1-p1 / transcript=Cvel_20233.t1 / gene=Cvel_20233 / organism=Chromera_velia_CCMP2878 / gene_product=hypothetical protein / transcript_product=hypothetical protein / location=Cvel_scaffold1802:35716-36818(+) / protein_length=238 / sequence_SO=supercontig / SO=protein_coding / is_pseudo=false